MTLHLASSKVLYFLEPTVVSGIGQVPLSNVECFTRFVQVELDLHVLDARAEITGRRYWNASEENFNDGGRPRRFRRTILIRLSNYNLSNVIIVTVGNPKQSTVINVN